MGQLIGVDVGGTKVSVAAMRDGTLSGPALEPTASTSERALVDELVEAVSELRDRDTAGVGVGVPSIVEFSSGHVKSSVNLELEDIPLRSVLEERLGLPVFVDNDANCAALAEAYEGAEMTVRNLVMLTVGTGVGGGLVLDGRLYRGATGAAGELGHTIIGASLVAGAPPAGRFPQEGSLEALASGRALDGLAGEEARRHPESSFGALRARGVALSGHDVVDAAQKGDEPARSLLDLLGQRLGIGIANAINTFDPDVVAIGGGVATAGELVLGPARETASRFIVPGVGEATEIRIARSGPEAGVRGAALLAAHELETAKRGSPQARG